MPRTVRLVSRKASAAANYREIPESDGENDAAPSSSPRDQEDEDEPYDEDMAEPPARRSSDRTRERTRSIPNRRTSIRVKVRPQSSSTLIQEGDDDEEDEEEQPAEEPDEEDAGMEVDGNEEEAGSDAEEEEASEQNQDEVEEDDDGELPYFSLTTEEGVVTKTQVADREGLPVRRKPPPPGDEDEDDAGPSRKGRKAGRKSAAAAPPPVLVLVDGVPTVKTDSRTAPKKKGRPSKPLFGRKRTREDEEDGQEGEEDSGEAVSEISGLKSYVRPGSTNPTVIVKNEVYELYKDELVLDEDEAGNTKIDEKGRLLGGRCFKAVTFSSPYREDPDVHYILSVDGARSGGFRDSLYFYRQNPLFLKVSLVQEEKEFLIQAGRLSSQLRGRNVTMLPVRNVFKCHGAKMVRNGRAVTDDYYEAAARAAGKKEGELVKIVQLGGPSARRRDLDRERSRNKRSQDVYSHQSVGFSGEAVITMFGDSGEAPFIRAPPHSQRRITLQRSDLTERNWRLEMAKSVRGMNSEFMEYRRERLEMINLDESVPSKAKQRQQLNYGDRTDTRTRVPGLYDPYTHTPHFPRHLQSHSARIEKVSARPDLPGLSTTRKGPILGGTGVGQHSWGIASVTTALREPPEFVEPCYVLPIQAGTWPEDTDGPDGEAGVDLDEEVDDDADMDDVDEDEDE